MIFYRNLHDFAQMTVFDADAVQEGPRTHAHAHTHTAAHPRAVMLNPVGGRGVGPPLYFPYGSTIDFTEIEYVTFFE